MFNDGYDELPFGEAIPTVDMIKKAAVQECSEGRLQINWDKMDSPEARNDMETSRYFVKRLPMIEKFYNLWLQELQNDDTAAVESSMWVYHNLVEELFSGYQLEEMLLKYDLVRSIEGLDKQV